MTTGKPGMRTVIPMKGRVGKNTCLLYTSVIALALSDSNLVFHWLSEDPEIALNMSSMPVSYTHLDVYKRQVEYLVRYALLRLYGIHRHQYSEPNHVADLQGQDVYKRQPSGDGR